jgi:uncharacterized sporulation protein YeaH/YhbH (DUF444 family)
MKQAASSHEQGEEKQQRLVKNYREEVKKLVASKKREDVSACAANTAIVSLSAALNNITTESVQQGESLDALSILVQGPLKRKALDEETLAREAGGPRGNDRAKKHRRTRSRSNNTFLSSAFTPCPTVQE